MPDATLRAGFTCPDLTTFCRLDELGLEVTGQRLEPERAVLACRVVEPYDSTDGWCRRCGSEGNPRDTVTRQLAHEPLGWRPTILEVIVRRYRCAGCGHVWRQDTSLAAEPRAKVSRRGLRWALEAIVVGHLTVARVAEGLGVAWDTANDAVLAELAVVAAHTGDSTECSQVGERVTPKSDFQISTAIGSPDASTVAFIAGRGQESALFTVPTSGGDPTKVADLETADAGSSAPTFLVEWRK